MEFKIDKDLLIKNLWIVGKFAGKNSNIPHVGAVLIVANDSGLTLKCNNLESACEVPNIECEVINSGKCCLPAKTLISLINKLSGIITFTEKDNVITIINNKFKTKLTGYDAEEFPEVRKAPSTPIQINLPEIELKALIENTAFAVSKDINKPILTGVCIDLNEDNLSFVATNGFRLAAKTYKSNNTKNIKCIVPVQFLNNINRDLKTKDQSVILLLTETDIVIKYAGINYQSFLIEGDYPNWKDLFPKKEEFKTVITIDKDELKEVLERVSLIKSTDTSSKREGIKLCFKNNILEIKAESLNVGEAVEEVPCQMEGEEINIHFNYNYLLESLNKILNNEVKISLTTPTKAGTIVGAEENPKFGYIIMPIRMN